MNPLITPQGMTRRHFFGHLATSAMAVPAFQFASALRAQASQGRKPHKSCILLWMGGGPSHMDTWDLKPESEKNAGEFRPIDTAAPGVQICEHLPTVAKQMNRLNLVRSLNSREGNHDRGTYMMHTGYAPSTTVVHPGFGSVCSYELGPNLGASFHLPHAVAINSPSEGAGFLGMSHSPFYVQNPTAEIANLMPPKGVQDRMGRRLALLGSMEDRFIKERRGYAPADHKTVYSKTVAMMTSADTRAFELDDEPDALRDLYGRNNFGQGCLMARRLVEAGVSFVEVSLGGWDNHTDIFDTLSKGNLPKLDKAMGALVQDLAASGLLDDTLVVWMGEFGRTPRINQDGGRDHWPQSWSVVLGGGGLKGGQVVGATDKDGVEIVDREVGVMDVMATMATVMGIDLDTQYHTPNGRPIRLIDGGKPISELL